MAQDKSPKNARWAIDFFAESLTMTNRLSLSLFFSFSFADHESVRAWIIYWCNTGLAVAKSMSRCRKTTCENKDFSPKYWHKSPAAKTMLCIKQLSLALNGDKFIKTACMKKEVGVSRSAIKRTSSFTWNVFSASVWWRSLVFVVNLWRFSRL